MKRGLSSKNCCLGIKQSHVLVLFVFFFVAWLDSVQANDEETGILTFSSTFCETEAGLYETQDFDAFLQLQFTSDIHLDAPPTSTAAAPQDDSTTVRRQLEQAVGLAYLELIATGCDVAHHRAFRGPQDFPPQIISPSSSTTSTSTTKSLTVDESSAPTPVPSSQPSPSPSTTPTTSIAPTSSPSTSQNPTTTPTRSMSPTTVPTMSRQPSSLPSVHPSPGPSIGDEVIFPQQVNNQDDDDNDDEQEEGDNGPPQRRRTVETTPTNSVLLHLKLKRRIPVDASPGTPPSSLANALDDDNHHNSTVRPSDDQVLAFLESSFFPFCTLTDLRESNVFVQEGECADGEFSTSSPCRCARDSCFCPLFSNDIQDMTQTRFQTVLENYLPLVGGGGSDRERRDLTTVSSLESRSLNSINGIAQVSEMQEFAECQVTRTVTYRIVHLINQDPLTLSASIQETLLNSLTNLVNTANRNNCDLNFKQVVSSTLEFRDTPSSSRRHLLDQNGDTLYTYEWIVVVEEVDNGMDGQSFYAEQEQETNDSPTSSPPTDESAAAIVMVDGTRRCFCPKFTVLLNRGITYTEYTNQVTDLVESDNLVPGATTLDAVVELEERTCGGDTGLVESSTTVVFQLAVGFNSLSESDKAELERACVRAYNQANAIRACDTQQYRITSCTLLPLVPQLPAVDDDSPLSLLSSNPDGTTDARLDFNFSCVGCVATESPFATESQGRQRRLAHTHQAMMAYEEWNQRQLSDNSHNDTATCICPRGVEETTGENRPTVTEFVIEFNVTGQVGDADNALEAKEEDCGTGVVLFAGVTLGITGNLTALTETERAALEAVFRETVNALSIELCDPNYIYAFATALQIEDKDNDEEAVMDLGFLCYGEGCTTADGAARSVFSDASGDNSRRRRQGRRLVAPDTPFSDNDTNRRPKLHSLSRDRQDRLLAEFIEVPPGTSCWCDRQSQGTTAITQDSFNARLQQEIAENSQRFPTISAVQATGLESTSAASTVMTGWVVVLFLASTWSMLLVSALL